MNIRESKVEDISLITTLHEEAFGESEGNEIALLVRDMLKDETAKPITSLVIEDKEKIAGHIIFSSVKIEDSENLIASILAPLAISKKYQQKGYGTNLIKSGLEILRKQGVEIVLVLGDPKYYNRIGFNTNHNIEAPYILEYPEAWMALELNAGVLGKATGMAKCAVSLSAPEYW